MISNVTGWRGCILWISHTLHALYIRRWPAIVCEGDDGDWNIQEEDEDEDIVRVYHVLFLGKVKSRAWVEDDKVSKHLHHEQHHIEPHLQVNILAYLCCAGCTFV